MLPEWLRHGGYCRGSCSLIFGLSSTFPPSLPPPPPRHAASELGEGGPHMDPFFFVQLRYAGVSGTLPRWASCSLCCRCSFFLFKRLRRHRIPTNGEGAADEPAVPQFFIYADHRHTAWVEERADVAGGAPAKWRTCTTRPAASVTVGGYVFLDRGLKGKWPLRLRLDFLDGARLLCEGKPALSRQRKLQLVSV